ncbi:MAG: hypothetical protein MUE85_05165 [Microscillaceae bacterium]|jgi:hypothetical protein|nr:hypothetical protein [Microscillaceae bacterium]
MENKGLDYILMHFFDKSISKFSKFITFFILLLLALFIDNYFEFTHNWNVNAKIKQISDIEAIIKASKDTSVIKNLKNLEKTIINKKNISDYVDFLGFVGFIYSTNSRKNATINANPIFYYLSSNIVLFLFFFYYIFKGVVKSFKKLDIWRAFAYAYISLGFILGLMTYLSAHLTAFLFSNSNPIIIQFFYNMIPQLSFGLLAILTIEFLKYRFYLYTKTLEAKNIKQKEV